MADDQQRGEPGPRGAEGAAGARGAEGAAGGRGAEGVPGGPGKTGPSGTGTTQITFISRGTKIALVLSWLAMAGLFVWLLTTSATVNSLHKTDSIACQFLKADAVIRQQQAQNTRSTTLDSELFEAYIRAERQLVASLRDGTVQNVALTKELAGIGQRLSRQLNC